MTSTLTEGTRDERRRGAAGGGQQPAAKKPRREERREVGHLVGSALKHTIGKKVMWLIIEKHAFLAETYAKIAKDVMRCEHAVGDIIRAWKRYEGLDPGFRGSTGRFSVSEHEMGLIRGLMDSRPDTFVKTELVQLVRRHCGQRQQSGTPSDRERIETYTQRGDFMISLDTHMDGVSFVHGSSYEPRGRRNRCCTCMISPAARMQSSRLCAQQMRSPGAAGHNRAPAASGVSDISDARTHCGHRAVQSALRSAAYHSVAGAVSGGTHAVPAADARQLVSHAALPRKRGAAAADTHHESHLQM